MRPATGGRAWAAAVALLVPGGAHAQTLLTQEEALRLAFPEPVRIERRTAFLDEATIARIRERAGPGAEIHQRVVTYYAGVENDREVGFAYFDAHRVRTLNEVLMVVVTPAGRVRRIEVLSFAEPREYLPPDRWLAQFEGTGLDDRTGGKGGIVNLTGATLTSRAVSRAVRRILALHEAIHGVGGAAEPAGAGSPGPGIPAVPVEGADRRSHGKPPGGAS